METIHWEKLIFIALYLGKLLVLCYADKFTVARLIKVVMIAETFIIGDSIRGQSNVRHEQQLISVEGTGVGILEGLLHFLFR